MDDRACVFVDGENFRHSITGLFECFDRTQYLPRDACWTDLFEWLVEEATDGEARRVRTYWYVIEHLEFFPYRFPNPEAETEQLKALLSKDAGLAKQIEPLEDQPLIETMRRIVARLIGRRDAMQRRFDYWLRLQNNIAQQGRAVEYRRAGTITYSLFDQRLGKEKAVDVKLATDLITLRDIYDVAIIVSGDQDYVPAVQVIKDSGKRVINIAFRRRDGRLLPGGARKLNQRTDWSLHVEHAQLARYLNIEDRAAPGEPPPARACP